MWRHSDVLRSPLGSTSWQTGWERDKKGFFVLEASCPLPPELASLDAINTGLTPEAESTMLQGDKMSRD